MAICLPHSHLCKLRTESRTRLAYSKLSAPTLLTSYYLIQLEVSPWQHRSQPFLLYKPRWCWGHLKTSAQLWPMQRVEISPHLKTVFDSLGLHFKQSWSKSPATFRMLLLLSTGCSQEVRMSLSIQRVQPDSSFTKSPNRSSSKFNPLQRSLRCRLRLRLPISAPISPYRQNKLFVFDCSKTINTSFQLTDIIECWNLQTLLSFWSLKLDLMHYVLC